MARLSSEKKFPHEMPEYQQLKKEETLTEQNLLSFRDRIYPFIIEDPAEGPELTLRFRKLKATEYSHVIGELNKIGIDTPLKALTQEQSTKFFAVECLALGYASADGKNAQDWLELNDKLVADTCFTYLIQISNPQENLSWFRGNSERPNARSPLPTLGKVSG